MPQSTPMGIRVKWYERFDEACKEFNRNCIDDSDDDMTTMLMINIIDTNLKDSENDAYLQHNPHHFTYCIT